MTGQGIQIQFKNQGPVPQIHARLHIGVHLSQKTDRFLIDENGAAPSWMEKRLGPGGVVTGIGKPQGIEQIFDNPFQAVKVSGRFFQVPEIVIGQTGQEPSEAFLLKGKLSPAAVDEDFSRLEDLQVMAAVIGIGPHGIQKTVDKGRSHHRLIIRQGIRYPERLRPVVFCGDVQDFT